MIGTFQNTYQRCIDFCARCLQACEECLTACMQEPDAQARTRCMLMLRDCADICALSVKYMSRNSAFAKQLCALCAVICEACAVECEMFKDPHCQDCARICRECAQECRMMAS